VVGVLVKVVVVVVVMVVVAVVVVVVAAAVEVVDDWYSTNAQYTPPTPRDETVLSRRRCEHELATSWRQFCRVVGVNTPVGGRDPVYNFRC